MNSVMAALRRAGWQSPNEQLPGASYRPRAARLFPEGIVLPALPTAYAERRLHLPSKSNPARVGGGPPRDKGVRSTCVRYA